jgi:hypothetical protein
VHHALVFALGQVFFHNLLNEILCFGGFHAGVAL